MNRLQSETETKPTWEREGVKLYLGDCLAVLSTLEAGSVDAVVTDPPYGLSFMGKDWDRGVPGVHFWAEALRVAKPGAHLLAFGGTRTFHRLTCAIEDAGWQIRDCIMWVCGSGFPKSLDVSKAIDKAAGAERNTADHKRKDREGWRFETQNTPSLPPATDAARQWEGWGTALKPAYESIVLARKPLEGTVAANVQKWGTGSINIDGCRIGSGGPAYVQPRPTTDAGGGGSWKKGEHIPFHYGANGGRWPANLIHDGSEEVLELFPQTKSGGAQRGSIIHSTHTHWGYGKIDSGSSVVGDSGSAARFFYCAKSSRAEREIGCEGMELVERESQGAKIVTSIDRQDGRGRVPVNVQLRPSTNHHPTVKPLALMRYLVRLVTPPNGTILDPFMGSGTTGMAAKIEGFRFIGIEKEQEYVAIAERRIEATA